MNGKCAASARARRFSSRSFLTVLTSRGSASGAAKANPCGSAGHRRAAPNALRKEVDITVLRIQGDHVAIGIEAPAEAPVHRREIYEKIRRPEAARRRVGRPR